VGQETGGEDWVRDMEWFEYISKLQDDNATGTVTLLLKDGELICRVFTPAGVTPEEIRAARMEKYERRKSQIIADAERRGAVAALRDWAKIEDEPWRVYALNERADAIERGEREP